MAKTVVDPSGCWLWQGLTAENGYGQIAAGGAQSKNLLTHRASYELHVGPIPEDLTIDHLCRVRNCINPEHLEAVTIRENILRGNGLPARNARKTHCKNGHKFTKANTLRDRRGSRICRTCTRKRQREWGRKAYWQKKQAVAA